MRKMIDYKNARGWLRPEEREALVEFAKDIGVNESEVIVNIGVEYGASLACLRAGNPIAQIYGIDIDTDKAVDNYDCNLIKADSSLLVHVWEVEGEGIDLLFIDGDHTYEGVKRDLKWIDFLRPGGHVIFHDCYDYDDPSLEVHGVCPGVNQAVEEWWSGEIVIAGNIGLDPSKAHTFIPPPMFAKRESVGTMRIFRRVV